MKKILTATIAALISTHCFAAMDKPGLSGEVSLMGGYSSSRSNFNTDNKMKTGDLNSSGESDSDSVFFPLGQLRYTFGEGASQQIFVGTARADIVQGVAALEIGYKYAVIPGSDIAISFLPTIVDKETWEDPFITGSDRTVTDKSGDALRFQYTNIYFTGLSVDAAYYNRKIDEEQSGSASYSTYTEQLKREGEGLYGKLSWRGQLQRGTSIIPSLRINRFSADGDAMSNTRLGAAATLTQRFEHNSIAFTADYVRAQYGETNPVFDKTQDNSELGFTLAYEYNGLFGWPGLAFNILMRYSDVNSNIEFYDENNILLASGVSIKF